MYVKVRSGRILQLSPEFANEFANVGLIVVGYQTSR